MCVRVCSQSESVYCAEIAFWLRIRLVAVHWRASNKCENDRQTAIVCVSEREGRNGKERFLYRMGHTMHNWTWNVNFLVCWLHQSSSCVSLNHSELVEWFAMNSVLHVVCLCRRWCQSIMNHTLHSLTHRHVVKFFFWFPWKCKPALRWGNCI